ncbi:hypothetical protein SAMN04515647_1612 [Cohaesibacter sp. ES.047]|uniref:hypothetical protein n=1 Tax=Cohaesibacter sp. ES.047 TaxID=1798205 RepID=UPI000BB78CD7|nr:hypothetical protein [Cohaesibacter sp. ES.047]SNY91390.1 hypothetical protein SAMN04515647_1612 [Cohaesibacter sp. ES.047]
MPIKQISIVTSRTHWRAGMHFVQGKPKLLDLDKLSKEQINQLNDDQELLVKELDGVAELSNEPLARPESVAEVIAAIQVAALNMPSADFTKAGKPRVDELEKALGWKASSDEIEAALDQMTDEQKAQLAALIQG